MGKILSLLLIFIFNSSAFAEDGCEQSPLDKKQVQELTMSACKAHDADLTNSCAYQKLQDAQKKRKTPEQLAKELQEKMVALNGGPLQESKLNATLVKKINDYSKHACGGGPVKIQDPSRTFEVATYRKEEVAVEESTEKNNKYSANKAKYEKIKGSCVPASDPKKLKCTGDIVQFIDKNLAEAYNKDDLKAYLEIVNRNALEAADKRAKSLGRDFDTYYGITGTNRKADLLIMQSNATATYQEDEMGYRNTKDASGESIRISTVIHKKGDLIFPEIKAAQDVAMKSAIKSNDRFFEAFNPTQDTGSYDYCPDPNKVVVDPISKFNSIAIHAPCDLSVGGNYVDNLVDPKKALVLDPNNDNACIAEAKKAGYEISSIVIKTSSSSLNNTGDAATRCCGKGFKCLSEARAVSAKEKLPELLNHLGFQMPSSSNAVVMDTVGSNGDGTSGPCAYTGTIGSDGKFSEQRIPNLTSALEKAKSVMVRVSFKKPDTPLPKAVFRQAMVSCQRLLFTCE